jgi:midasin (ATPase involved in ribosome maturation)
MTDMKQLLKDYQAADARLNKAIREEGNTFITSLFQSIFDQFPLVNKLATVGWTPGFNDGDACTHSAEYASGAWRIHSWRGADHRSYDYEDHSALEEFFTGVNPDDEDEEDDNEDEEGNQLVVDAPEVAEAAPVDEAEANRQAQEAKDLMEAYDNIFERVYVTNYLVTARRLPNGDVVVEDDEYDPGY